MLTPPAVPTRPLVPGAVGAGAGWTLLQALGGYLVAHNLRHASQLYGFFGIVLGLLSFLALAATITLYAAEAGVVWNRHLWPRSLLQPPLTDADERVLSAIAEQEERRPEQTVEISSATSPELRPRSGGRSGRMPGWTASPPSPPASPPWSTTSGRSWASSRRPRTSPPAGPASRPPPPWAPRCSARPPRPWRSRAAPTSAGASAARAGWR